jgi:eukaryotic-like serine/threonine-protein kinase
MSPSPAESLDKIILPNDWVVIERAESKQGSTGAFFSVGYIVESATTGKRAFLKALNLERILDEADEPLAALNDAIGIFQFERELCQQCEKMDRVVTILDSGDIRTDSADPFTIVPYLIFEEATGDVRRFVEINQDLDVAWALRSLHHIANGLQQLHHADIAHQDLKPSNALVFGRDLSKIADLGRASNRSTLGPFDGDQLAGARAYAPPELLYGQVAPEFNERRLACDLYLLGSMVAFFFTGASMTALWLERMEPSFRPKLLWGTWDDDYSAALPVVQAAFAEALDDFRAAVPKALRDELTTLVRQLCDPDPKRRGSPGARKQRHGNPFAIDSFVSRFNALATRSEARVRLRVT